MDIKLRSNKAERTEESTKEVKKLKFKHTGLLIFVAVFITLAMVYESVISAGAYKRYEERQINIQSQFSFLDNEVIADKVTRYAKNLNRYYLYYGGEKFNTLPDNEKVTPEDIAQKRAELSPEKYMEKIEELKNQQFSGNVTDYTVVDKLYKEYHMTDVDLVGVILAEKEENYEQISNYLKNDKDFAYSIQNKTTGETYTNMKEGVVGSYFSVQLDDQFFWNTDFNGTSIAEGFSNNNYSGQITLIENSADAEIIAQVDYINQQINGERVARDQAEAFLVLGIVLLAIVIIFAVLNYKKFLKVNAVFYKFYTLQPFIMKLAVAATISMFMLFEWPSYSPQTLRNFLLYHRGLDQIFMFAIVAAFILYLVLTVEYLIIVARNPRTLKNEMEVHLFHNFKRDMGFLFNRVNRMALAMYVLMILYTLGCLFLTVAIAEPAFLFFIVVSIFAHCMIIDYAKIVYYTSEMALGKLTDIPKERGIFTQPLTELVKIQGGMKLAVDEMMRSEKLKTELITNVSHDLKTPLTSIINYIALLKETPNQSEVAHEYIEVLDKKSERLKVLIEDLFEATKLNSGNVEMTKERIDLVDLINQTMGELGEKIEKSGITFKFSHVAERIYLDCDAKKMWRVFENIISNIIKYSPTGSRAYIEAVEDLKGISITFKNVSAYELNVSSEELFGRFTRGDSSRSTEGSGLGLSIALSIVELSGGKMNIEIDGDLFKVRIVF